MKKIIFLSALIGLLACNRCKEEVPPMPTPESDYYAPHLDNPPNDPRLYLLDRFAIPGQNLYEGTEYGYAHFNPNNPYEFVYTAIDNPISLNFTIYKFNFKTGVKTILPPKAYRISDWGANGWILYTDPNGQLWKVKDNGDSITRITANQNFNQDAKWSPNGQYTIHKASSFFELRTANGQYIKTIFNGVSYGIGWLNDSIVGHQTDGDVAAWLNINTEAISPIFASKASVAPVWDVQRKQIHYFSNKGLGHQDYLLRDNYETLQRDTLRSFFDSYNFYMTDYAPQTKKGIGLLRTMRYEDSLRSPNRIVNTAIVLFDLDGKNEKVIRLR
ncbi:MAG: hypothetical protein RL757_2337 [Bacteroidota bacterium]|jgi:hypothetical protein